MSLLLTAGVTAAAAGRLTSVLRGWRGPATVCGLVPALFAWWTVDPDIARIPRDRSAEDDQAATGHDPDDDAPRVVRDKDGEDDGTTTTMERRSTPETSVGSPFDGSSSERESPSSSRRASRAAPAAG